MCIPLSVVRQGLIVGRGHLQTQLRHWNLHKVASGILHLASEFMIFDVFLFGGNLLSCGQVYVRLCGVHYQTVGGATSLRSRSRNALGVMFQKLGWCSLHAWELGQHLKFFVLVRVMLQVWFSHAPCISKHSYTGFRQVQVRLWTAPPITGQFMEF